MNNQQVPKKICTKCILPETYPGISFDDEGVCNFCRAYESDLPSSRKEALLAVLKSENNPSPYDCIVPLSGGKDSSFILYYIVKECGLNPLVVSYNSGFQHPLAVQNVRTACEILGVVLEETHSPGKIQQKLLKASYKLSQKTGMIWGCANCPAILRWVPIKAARKHEVPFVIWGSSVLEVVSEHESGEARSSKLQLLLKDPTIALDGFKYVFYRMMQRIALGFPLREILRPFSIPPFTEENPKFVNFYDYIYWDSMRYVQDLKEQMGWQHPEGQESRFDCTLNCIGNVFFLKDYGISHDGITLSNFVREGKLDRENALEKEQGIVEAAQEEYRELIERIRR